MNEIVKRRFFLKGILSFTAVMGLKKIGVSENMFQKEELNQKYFINPAFKVDTSLTGRIVLSTNLPGGKVKELKFENFENEILKYIKQNKSIQQITFGIAKKYSFTDSESTQKCNTVIKKFENEGIIVTKKSEMNIIQNTFKKRTDNEKL